MSTFPKWQIGEIIEHLLEHSPFYRERFAASTPFCRDLLDYEWFSQLPCLKREDVLLDSHRLRGRHKVTRVHFSGGTLGRPKSIYYTPEDWQRAVESNAECLRIAGVTQQDRVAILQPFGAWSIGQIYLDSVSRLGGFGIPLGIYMDDQDAAALIAGEQASVLMGAPGNLCRLAHQWLQDDRFPSLPPMRLLILAGEAVQPGQREFLKKVWNAEIRSLYGSAETDSLGVECGASNGLHLSEADFFAELITEDGPRELAAGLEGELVITTLQRDGTPLIRYRLGDQVLCLDRGCTCGHEGWRLEFLGRNGQTISFHDGTKLYAEQIYSAVEDVLPDFLGCQILIRGANGLDQLECVIFGCEDVADPILQKIAENIKRSSIDVGDVLAAGLLESVTVRAALPDEMVLNHRGKSVLFQDLRTTQVSQTI